MKIFIAGASGALGSHLVRQLVARVAGLRNAWPRSGMDGDDPLTRGLLWG
jgi:nucleoside-diphosphate-sugar epimerase